MATWARPRIPRQGPQGPRMILWKRTMGAIRPARRRRPLGLRRRKRRSTARWASCCRRGRIAATSPGRPMTQSRGWDGTWRRFGSWCAPTKLWRPRGGCSARPVSRNRTTPSPRSSRSASTLRSEWSRCRRSRLERTQARSSATSRPAPPPWPRCGRTLWSRMRCGQSCPKQPNASKRVERNARSPPRTRARARRPQRRARRSLWRRSSLQRHRHLSMAFLAWPR
mmetsp:Transcript_31151/g.70408  ORF Transcript_31151/g.70408 Transcript_31151/m.70408 type:complete len:225 (+) Transcript_31151:230-904(+)